jgi:cation-transporting ATPase 13A3/4/5
LVPGDVFVLNDNMMVPCDCILLSGEVFVNEVTLTGESIPVPKCKLEGGPDGYFIEDQKANVKSVLFEGTQVIKTRGNACLALVQRTGFSTFKGQIFRSLVFVKS